MSEHADAMFGEGVGWRVIGMERCQEPPLPLESVTPARLCTLSRCCNCLHNALNAHFWNSFFTNEALNTYQDLISWPPPSIQFSEWSIKFIYSLSRSRKDNSTMICGLRWCIMDSRLDITASLDLNYTISLKNISLWVHLRGGTQSQD